MENIENFLLSNGWGIVYKIFIPEKIAEYHCYDDLNLSDHSKKYLSQFGNGIYLHQKLALERSLNGSNVCITTSTASGKSLVFYVNAIERLFKNPDARILAIYPLKALGTEQQNRWEKAIKDSGLSFSVGRIDGSIPVRNRTDILKNNSIITMTPDIIHAWLLSNLNTKLLLKFLAQVELIIVDEAHVYSGVFGSNSAFLFRRINHIIEKLGGRPTYIAASATIKNPDVHLKNLIGLDFSIIDHRHETSPKKASHIILVNPPDKSKIISTFSDLMKSIAANTNHQFISFVDSRKQTEYLATISARQSNAQLIEETENFSFDHESSEDLKIYPYRSGYEEIDRIQIQNKLANGQLKGAISTSALEMGIDIPYLSLGILFGMPNSATSFFQRIGRIGRHREGIIIIINNGSLLTEIIFRNPEAVLKIPLSESTLYLENPRIQYIHTLCLARQDGENDRVNNYLGIIEDKFESEENFPESFVRLCNAERIGEISLEFQTMKGQAANDPNHIFPLRDIDVDYKVEWRSGPNFKKLGSLTYSQLMREAYPGAIYYYQTQAYRVFRVNVNRRLVEVRRERKYTTKPIFLPHLIFPNLSEGNIYNFRKVGDLIVMESNLQISESVVGYLERRGLTEHQINYPLDPAKGLYFDQPRFTRYYFTTGVIFNHPSLNDINVNRGILADILFNAFLMTIPFERQDISFGFDKHRTDRDYFKEGDRFVSIFDHTYGSLRLTSRLMEPEILASVFEKSIDIAENEKRYDINPETLSALKEMNDTLSNEDEAIALESSEVTISEQLEKIILPGSKGLNIRRSNEEFFIEDVFFRPEGLAYRGKHLSQLGSKFKNTEVVVPVKFIIEISGETKIGYYNYYNGQIEEQ